MSIKSTFYAKRWCALWLTGQVLLTVTGCLPLPTRPRPTFPTQASTLPAAPEHLTLGNPTEANQAEVNNYLVNKPQYSLSFNQSRGIANWVSWHLSPEWRGAAPRSKSFRPDPDLPAGLSSARPSDYERTGFDRGHLCPSEDRDSSPADNAATFVLSNVVPQAPKFNRETWKYLEEYARKQVEQGNEVYLVAGPDGVGGTGEAGYATSVGASKITVPAALWKVLLIMPLGTDDLNRITPNTTVVAVYIPNNQSVDNQPWSRYRLSVNELEAKIGLRFFTNLPPDVQAGLKRQTSGN